jgi:dihydrofolate reductase
MKISMIAAIGKNRQLGLKGQIPWHLKGDLQYFKSVTMGRYIMMGRTTFLGLPQALPGRKMVVVSHIPIEPAPADAQVFGNIDDAVNYVEKMGAEELIVAGGQRIYEQMLPRCQKLYLTKVDYDGAADAYFPDYQESQWNITKGTVAGGGDDGTYAWQTWILERK